MKHLLISLFIYVSLATCILLILPSMKAFSLKDTTVRAAPMKPNTKIAAHFFNWYSCDGSSCWFGNKYGFIPDFMYTSYPEGGYYSGLNKNYFKREFYDMYSAGIDYALIVSWGDHPWRWYRTRSCPWWYGLDNASNPRSNPPQDTSVLTNCGVDTPHEQSTNQVFSTIDIMVNALTDLETKGVPMKVGFFDDTGSQPAEYNLYQRGMINHETYASGDRIGYDAAYKPFPLCDATAVNYFYNAKYKPFFSKVPKKYWATHNGLPPEQGGRPIIVTFAQNGNFSQNECSPQVFGEVYNRFRADFGINPYIIVDRSWVRSNGSLLAHIDNQTLFGSAIVNGYQSVSDTKDAISVSSVSPGFNNTIMNPTNPGVWSRNTGATFDGRFNNTPPSDILIVETWNELGERTSIARAHGYDCDSDQVAGCGYCDSDHPRCTPLTSSQTLSDTYYINKLRQLSGRTSRTPVKTLAELSSFFAPNPTSTPSQVKGDLNNTGKVDIVDLNLLFGEFGKTGSPGFTNADLVTNGKVEIFDYSILIANFGK